VESRDGQARLIGTFIKYLRWIAKMSVKLPDLDAPILPGISAAGIKIGSEIKELLDQARPMITEDRSAHMLYDFGSVKVWSSGGLISQIGVYAGYRGCLDNRICIGSSIADVEARCGCQVSEDEEDNLIAIGRPGWCFETEAWVENHTLERNRSARVTAIFVHNLEHRG